MLNLHYIMASFILWFILAQFDSPVLPNASIIHAIQLINRTCYREHIIPLKDIDKYTVKIKAFQMY